MKRLSSLEIELEIRVHILNEAIFVSFPLIFLGKGMNPYVLPRQLLENSRTDYVLLG